MAVVEQNRRQRTAGTAPMGAAGQREVCSQEPTSWSRLCPLGRAGCRTDLRDRSRLAGFVAAGWDLRVAEAVLAEATRRDGGGVARI